jgi:L-alanine-DL-glutamate epimerase-like enolase superfamily enzyme
MVVATSKSGGHGLKITDLKCAVIGGSPIVRITTDEGIDGLGQGEWAKPYLKPHVLFYRDYILGEDPTNVQRVMNRIRRLGGFKPWGTAVSAIEVALWDIAGKAAGLPVYKMLGGKVRDKVMVYNGGVRFPMTGHSPQHHAENMERMKESKEGFSIIKTGIAFHSQMPSEFPGFSYGEPRPVRRMDHGGPMLSDGGLLTERGLKHTIACVEAMKDVLGDEVGLALDCGPGFTVPDAIKLAKALEPLNIMWLEDMITGDYTPYVLADLYREVTRATSTPIHTGEQIYLRHHFKDLFEQKAVNVVGPDPLDVGGLAETKWIAEYADLHGVLIAPHGVADGLIGLAAHVQLAATLPSNYIALEYPVGTPDWWYEIVDGLPDPIVIGSFIDVWDKPGLGIAFDVNSARKHLLDEDTDFFD